MCYFLRHLCYFFSLILISSDGIRHRIPNERERVCR
nr:MAG TPA: hypothetical protein [Microviridae sp.]